MNQAIIESNKHFQQGAGCVQGSSKQARMYAIAGHALSSHGQASTSIHSSMMGRTIGSGGIGPPWPWCQTTRPLQRFGNEQPARRVPHLLCLGLWKCWALQLAELGSAPAVLDFPDVTGC